MKTSRRTLEAVRCSDDSGQPLKEIMLSPWGTVKANGMTFVMDQEAADAIIARFKSGKLPIPVDYEHTTEGGEFATASGAAPAAGWIEEIIAKPGVGLMAMVKWNARAQEMIAADEYRYISPSGDIEKETRRLVAVRSAALTNTPAIRTMERVAAKENQDMDLTQLESEVTLAANALRVSLTAAGATIADGLGWADILKAAQDFAASVAQAKTDALSAVSPTATIAAKLGLDANVGVETIVVKVGELVTGRVPQAEFEKMVARVNELQDLETSRTAERLIAKAINDGKINPNDKELMTWASDLAKSPAEFVRWEKIAAKVVPVGTLTKSSATLDGKKSDRIAMIANSREEYKANRWLQKPGAEPFYISAALKVEGFDPLDDSEVKAL